MLCHLFTSPLKQAINLSYIQEYKLKPLNKISQNTNWTFRALDAEEQCEIKKQTHSGKRKVMQENRNSTIYFYVLRDDGVRVESIKGGFKTDVTVQFSFIRTPHASVDRNKNAFG